MISWPWWTFPSRSWVSSLPSPSLLPIASLFPLPERTKRTISSLRKVQSFFVRATHVAITHRHRLDAVLGEELVNLLLHLHVLHDLATHPALDYRFGSFMQDDACGNLGRRLGVGTVERHGANGIVHRFRRVVML